MRLNDASVVIRPRTPWEAMDLGVLLSQQHRRLLMLSWAIVTLPVFALLTALLWDSPSLALLLFWWLKPAFERLPLYILSSALFGQTPTLKHALRQWPRLLKPQLLASLTWRRFNLSRSFTLPVVQLEGLDGPDRQRRLAVLQQDAGAARWLTVMGALLETTLWIGFMVLFYLLLPEQVELDWDWQTLIAATKHDWRWLEHLVNALYVLILILWEPVYVACGFSLYLNRRIDLEAWDIELVFRRLRQRLGNVVTCLLMVGLLWLPGTQPAWADEPADAPTSPRLLQQPLTSQAASDSINAVLDAPPFKNTETVTRYRFGKDRPDPTGDAQAPGWLQTLLEWLGGQRFNGLAQVIEVLLWSAILAALAWLAWRYRDGLHRWKRIRGGPPINTLERATFVPTHDLELRPAPLPDDIAAHVEHLWPSQPREALGLLYRALLSRLVHDFNLPLTSADTEAQVLEQILHLQRPDLHAYSQRLTSHWQALAYGHRLPPAGLQQELCEGWRALFGTGAS